MTREVPRILRLSPDHDGATRARFARVIERLADELAELDAA